LLGKKRTPLLLVIDGSGKSKSFKLTKTRYTIGADKKCVIQLAGDYVSDLHAIVEKQTGGRWMLTNNSPDGTYLNETKIESEFLVDGATIQIGTDCRLEYSSGEGAANRGANDEDNSNSGSGGKKKGRKIGKWPMIIGGVIVFYLPLFLYLHNMTKGIAEFSQESIFSLAMIDEAIESSQFYLSELPVVGKNKGTEKLAREGLAGDYFLLTSSNALASDDREKLVKNILIQSNKRLTNAHSYHMMALPDKAIAELQKVMRLVPDHRNPVTGFAARTIANIQYQAALNGQ